MSPWLVPTPSGYRGRNDMLKLDERVEAFRRHYETSESHWGRQSGAGSHPYWNIDYRAFLERFIVINNIRIVIDIGCGDWQFSRFLNFDGVRYYGFDVVESVVAQNRALYSSENVTFDIMPLDFAEMPHADLLIMKDVLQHLLDTEIMRHKRELFSRYPRCLLSNSYRKFETPMNIDVAYGGFRSLDLNAPPYEFRYEFRGEYVLEFSTPLWEQIRTMLYIPR
jgi:SAM-dependent methyltransferase